MPNPLLSAMGLGKAQNALPNNIQQLQSLYKMFSSNNPMQVMESMASHNPQLQPVMNMLRSGGNPEAIARQMMAQRGINPDEFIKAIKGGNNA